MAVSINDANNYFETEVLLNDAWVSADESMKARALKNAENTLYRFYSAHFNSENPLPEKAVYEQAYWLLLIDETIQKSALGVKQISISGISISVNAPQYPISPNTKMIIQAETGVGGSGVRVGRYRL